MLRIGRLAERRQDHDRRGDRRQGQVRIGACAGSSEAPAMRSRLASRQHIRHKIPPLISPYACLFSFELPVLFAYQIGTRELRRRIDPRCAGFDYRADDLFRAAAARMSVLKASSSISSPSWKSIARLALPSRLELNSPEGSLSEAPLEKVSFTTLLYVSPVQISPS